MVLDPLGFPVRPLTHLLRSESVSRALTPQTILAAPRADPWEAERARMPEGTRDVTCFGQRECHTIVELL